MDLDCNASHFDGPNFGGLLSYVGLKGHHPRKSGTHTILTPSVLHLET